MTGRQTENRFGETSLGQTPLGSFREQRGKCPYFYDVEHESIYETCVYTKVADGKPDLGYYQ